MAHKSANDASANRQRIVIPGGLSQTIKTLSFDLSLASIPRIDIQGNMVPILAGIPLLGKLGEGSMGAVYWGFHPRLNKEVAIKLLRISSPSDDDEFEVRFRREAEMAMTLESPHVVKVFEIAEDQGLHVMSMEYVDCLSVGELMDDLLLSSETGMREKDALKVCLAASKGLAAAHEKGIVHRDIKPDNILIPYDEVRNPSYADSKLTDFGIGRSESFQAGLTKTEIFMGSPGFMAPEQAESFRAAKAPADVFSMGATLYMLLTGRAPFEGRTPIATIIATMEAPHGSLQGYRPEVSGATFEVVEHCLKKRHQERYQNGAELAGALAACLKDCPS